MNFYGLTFDGTTFLYYNSLIFLMQERFAQYERCPPPMIYGEGLLDSFPLCAWFQDFAASIGAWRLGKGPGKKIASSVLGFEQQKTPTITHDKYKQTIKPSTRKNKIFT